MNRVKHKIITLLVLISAGLQLQAQQFKDDFENQYTWYPPWSYIHIVPDSTAAEGRFVCLCDTTMEYGLGIAYTLPDSLLGNNIHLDYKADFRWPDTLGSGSLVVSIKKKEGDYRFWQSFSLDQYANDSAAWFPVRITMNLPTDYLKKEDAIGVFLWNTNRCNILINNALFSIEPIQQSYLPKLEVTENGERRTESLQLSVQDEPLTKPIGMLVEYILDGDTLTDYQLFEETEDGRWSVENDLLTTLMQTWTSQHSSFNIHLSTTFHKDGLLLRQALVVPFIDSTLTVYRRNMETENGERRTENGGLSQKEYYLDREGFKVGEGERSVISYHQQWISSTQLDAENRTAYFNLDYWRDHPMIHYPLNDTLQDVFEDRSSRHVHEGMEWSHLLTLYLGSDLQELPRMMPIPLGYESGIIFTEHADWTDLRTHRAVLFGSEKVAKAKKATGGFVYYGIPVTKSVFYNNPDGVTNDAISHGAFTGPIATIKTHRKFETLLFQLHKLGFDICLHTPEQYTTTKDNFKQAMHYMQAHFKTTTWIDHGYNNSKAHNREDMVCDGLDRKSVYHTADQWRYHGINYLWNPYYEENRMEQWSFDNNLTQPYPGFGDALPNRQITTLAMENEPFHGPFLTWCTPTTVEVYNDREWDYYFSEERLQRLVDEHQVHIIHAYPAWVNPAKGFWTYDADSTLIAQPGFNRALARIAALHDEHKMLPMTIRTYLDYYQGLLDVKYEIIDAEHIRLKNQGGNIKGFTLLCPCPIRFEDNRYYEFRKVGDQYYVWFDLKAGEEVGVEIRNGEALNEVKRVNAELD